jgi:hypothetical protein
LHAFPVSPIHAIVVDLISELDTVRSRQNIPA